MEEVSPAEIRTVVTVIRNLCRNQEEAETWMSRWLEGRAQMEHQAEHRTRRVFSKTDPATLLDGSSPSS